MMGYKFFPFVIDRVASVATAIISNTVSIVPLPQEMVGDFALALISELGAYDNVYFQNYILVDGALEFDAEFSIWRIHYLKLILADSGS